MALDPNIKTRPLNINDLDPSEYTVVEEKEDEDEETIDKPLNINDLDPSEYTVVEEADKETITVDKEAIVKPLNINDLDPSEYTVVEEPKEESSYFDKVVLDSAISLSQGFVGLGQAAVGLFDIPTLGYAGKGLEYTLDNVFGGDLADLTQWLQSFKTDEQLLAERELSEVKDFLPTIKELATNPGALSNTILRTLPQMIGGWGIGRKILSEVGKYGAKKGLGVKATQELIKKNAVKATGAGEGIIATGAMAEDIRQQSEDGLITPTQAALSVGSGALTGILGTLGAKVANRLDVTDIDVLVTAGRGAQKAEAKSALVAAIKSGVLEATIEELPQSMQEQVAMNIAVGRPPLEGVPEAAAEGMMAAFVIAGSVSGVNQKLTNTKIKRDNIAEEFEKEKKEEKKRLKDSPDIATIKKDGFTELEARNQAKEDAASKKAQKIEKIKSTKALNKAASYAATDGVITENVLKTFQLNPRSNAYGLLLNQDLKKPLVAEQVYRILDAIPPNQRMNQKAITKFLQGAQNAKGGEAKDTAVDPTTTGASDAIPGGQPDANAEGNQNLVGTRNDINTDNTGKPISGAQRKRAALAQQKKAAKAEQKKILSGKDQGFDTSVGLADEVATRADIAEVTGIDESGPDSDEGGNNYRRSEPYNDSRSEPLSNLARISNLNQWAGNTQLRYKEGQRDVRGFEANPGELIPFYHATDAKDDFSTFLTFPFPGRGAIYASPSPEEAQRIAFQYGNIQTGTSSVRNFNPDEGSRVLPVYVRAENVWDYESADDIDIVYQEIQKQKSTAEALKFKNGVAEQNYRPIEDNIDIIESLGYDGFFIMEPTTSGNSAKNIGVFDPNQLKSAIGNDGGFSTENDDIQKSILRDTLENINEQIEENQDGAITPAQQRVQMNAVFDTIVKFQNKISAVIPGEVRTSAQEQLEQIKRFVEMRASAIQKLEDGTAANEPGGETFASTQVNELNNSIRRIGVQLKNSVLKIQERKMNLKSYSADATFDAILDAEKRIRKQLVKPAINLTNALNETFEDLKYRLDIIEDDVFRNPQKKAMYEVDSPIYGSNTIKYLTETYTESDTYDLDTILEMGNSIRVVKTDPSARKYQADMGKAKGDVALQTALTLKFENGKFNLARDLVNFEKIIAFDLVNSLNLKIEENSDYVNAVLGNNGITNDFTDAIPARNLNDLIQNNINAGNPTNVVDVLQMLEDSQTINNTEKEVVKILKKVPGMSDVSVERMQENGKFGYGVLGYYQEQDRSLKIKMLNLSSSRREFQQSTSDMFATNATIIHEIVHAATVGITETLFKNPRIDDIRNPNLLEPKNKLGQQLKDIMVTVYEANIENEAAFDKRQDFFEETAGYDSDSYYPPGIDFSSPGYRFNKEYGMTNPLEFLAESFSNESFQIGLAQIPSKVEKKANLFESLWDDFIIYVQNAITSVNNRARKQPPNIDIQQRSVLNDLVAIAPSLMQGPQTPADNSKTPNFKKTTNIEQEGDKLLKESGQKPAAPPPPPKVPKYVTAGDDPRFDTVFGYVGAGMRWVQTKVFNFEAALNGAIRKSMRKQGVTPKDFEKAFYMLDSGQAVKADDVATNFIFKGDIKWDEDTSKAMVEENGMSMKDLEKQLLDISGKKGIPLQKVVEHAHSYFVALRNKGLRSTNLKVEKKVLSLLAQGKKTQAKKVYAAGFKVPSMTIEQQRSGLKQIKLYPELAEVSNIWNAVRENVINFAVESGLYTEEQAQKLLDVMDYVPFYRAMGEKIGPQENTRGLLDAQTDKKYKGSYRPVHNVFDNMEKWAHYIVRKSVQNQSAVNKVVLTKKYMGNIGTSPNDWVIKDTTNKNKNDGTTIVVWMDGKKESFQYRSKIMSEAFTGLEPAALPMLRFLAPIINTLRLNIVLNPIFSIIQIPMDAFATFLTSGVKFPVMLPLQVVKEIALSTVGLSNARTQLKKATVAGIRDYSKQVENVEKEIRRNGYRQETSSYKKILEVLVAPLQKFSQMSDNLIRQAVYSQTMLETNDARLATLRAAEIINFRRTGSAQIVNIARQLAPFVNANLQALNVVGGTLLLDGISPQTKMQALGSNLNALTQTVPLVIMYNMLMGGEEEFEKLDPAYRDNVLFIPSGFSVDKDSPLGITFQTAGFTMPLRPDLWTLIAKVIPEHLYQAYIEDSEDSEKMKLAFKRALLKGIATPGPMPTGIGSFLEAAYNYDLYKDRPIVGRGQEKFSGAPEEQYTRSTSQFSISVANFFAEETGKTVSPMYIDHILRGTLGYTAGIIQLFTERWMADINGIVLPKNTGIEGIMAMDREGLRDIPGTFRLYTSEEGSRNQGDFYELREQVNEIYKTYKALDTTTGVDKAKAEKYRDENQEFLDVYESIKVLDGRMAQIRKLENEVYRNPNMEPAEKEKELRRYAEERQDQLGYLVESGYFNNSKTNRKLRRLIEEHRREVYD